MTALPTPTSTKIEAQNTFYRTHEAEFEAIRAAWAADQRFVAEEEARGTRTRAEARAEAQAITARMNAELRALWGQFDPNTPTGSEAPTSTTSTRYRSAYQQMLTRLMAEDIMVSVEGCDPIWLSYQNLSEDGDLPLRIEGGRLQAEFRTPAFSEWLNVTDGTISRYAS